MSALVVSLHDVSPLTRGVFTSMLRELAEVGVTKTSLLVIPDHHHRGHMLEDAGFCRWVEGLASAGLESQQGRAVPEEEAAGLLARAKEDFARLDVPAPTGFIAPAWLLGNGALQAVRKAHFAYTTLLVGVLALLGPDFIRSQSLVYSCRNAWRRVCSLLWNAGLRRRLRKSPLLRLGLHPPDYQHANVWQQIRRSVRKEASRREVLTYHGFVDQLRLSRIP